MSSLSAQVAAAATAQVTASALTLTAPVVSVNAAMATFSGVVACQTLMATSVVSAAYTPGVGNIL